MPLQNRVNPFGEIVADTARGTLMGNRGCLHNHNRKIVRTHRGRRWVTCTTVWPGIKRSLMTPDQYTELFFLDEATALAAGHRPCNDCRRSAAVKFQSLWGAVTTATTPMRATEIDLALDAERLRSDVVRSSAIAHVTGVMVSSTDRAAAWLAYRGSFRQWSFAGYQPVSSVPEQVLLLTPRTVVRVIAASYPVKIHPSA